MPTVLFSSWLFWLHRQPSLRTHKFARRCTPTATPSWIRAGHLVRLTSVNWYGFDQKELVVGGLDHAPLATIISQIRAIGVNSVRLPWANETLDRNPVVPEYAIKANPQFRGKRAMEVMDAVIDALAHAHLMIILDNHVSRADWCCKDDDGNGLWYNAEYPEDKWLADWQTIVRRYKHQPWVVGADLRNELRSGARWGGDDPRLDWHAAAERGGNAVLAVNPRSLVMVEGPEYSTDLTRVREATRHSENSKSCGLFAARVRNRRPYFSELRRIEASIRCASWILVAQRARRAAVGWRIRGMPDFAMRRSRAMVPLVCAIPARKRLELELLGAERNAIQRRHTQI